MESIQLIRHNLVQSEAIVLARIEDMRDACFVFPTPKGGAHSLWTLGHLAFIEALVIKQFMLAEPNPLAHWASLFDGEDVSADASLYPPFDEVLAMCRDMRYMTLEVIDALAESDLDQLSANAPEGFEALFGSYRLCLQFVADHWYMHRGQLADARRAAGRERMWF